MIIKSPKNEYFIQEELPCSKYQKVYKCKKPPLNNPNDYYIIIELMDLEVIRFYLPVLTEIAGRGLYTDPEIFSVEKNLFFAFKDRAEDNFIDLDMLSLDEKLELSQKLVNELIRIKLPLDFLNCIRFEDNIVFVSKHQLFLKYLPVFSIDVNPITASSIIAKICDFFFKDEYESNEYIHSLIDNCKNHNYTSFEELVNDLQILKKKLGSLEQNHTKVNSVKRFIFKKRTLMSFAAVSILIIILIGGTFLVLNQFNKAKAVWLEEEYYKGLSNIGNADLTKYSKFQPGEIQKTFYDKLRSGKPDPLLLKISQKLNSSKNYEKLKTQWNESVFIKVMNDIILNCDELLNTIKKNEDIIAQYPDLINCKQSIKEEADLCKFNRLLLETLYPEDIRHPDVKQKGD